MTITEALAEIKTIDKRLAKKREFVKQYLVLQGHMRDPFEKDGGAKAVIAAEHQAIRDLEGRKVEIRRAIANANASTLVAVGGEERTISDWLIWRREVAPARKQFLAQLIGAYANLRRSAAQNGAVVVENEPREQNEVVFVMSERELSQEAERLEEVEGTLDGILSLKNATVQVEI